MIYQIQKIISVACFRSQKQLCGYSKRNIIKPVQLIMRHQINQDSTTHQEYIQPWVHSLLHYFPPSIAIRRTLEHYTSYISFSKTKYPCWWRQQAQFQSISTRLQDATSQKRRTERMWNVTCIFSFILSASNWSQHSLIYQYLYCCIKARRHISHPFDSQHRKTERSFMNK